MNLISFQLESLRDCIDSVLILDRMSSSLNLVSFQLESLRNCIDSAEEELQPESDHVSIRILKELY